MDFGMTPMIRIHYRFRGKDKYMYAKLEYFHLTGSIKDRIASFILKDAKEKGLLQPSQPIAEATSGNTGISLAALGSFFHHPVHIFMPDWVSSERVSLMKLYGANVHLVSKEEGGFQEAIRRAKQYALEIGAYEPDQFSNPNNTRAHYETTGQEIVNQLAFVPAFVSGIGTGGTLMGVGKRLKEVFPNVKIVALEPKQQALLSGGNKGEHKIEGIGDDFVPALVDRNLIDSIILIDDMDAIRMSQKLSSELGLGVGISSGANFLACCLLDDGCVTVFADDNKKYLSTDLGKKIAPRNDFLSNQVELIDFSICKK